MVVLAGRVGRGFDSGGRAGFLAQVLRLFFFPQRIYR